MSHDRFTALTRLSPTVTMDDVCPPAEQAASRTRIMQAPPMSLAGGRRRGGRMAGAVVAASVVVLSAPGVAAAVGDGFRAQSFLDAFGYWDDNPGGGVETAQARRVGSLPGPKGGVFSVLAAESPDGITCVGPVFETSASSGASLPNNFLDGGSVCGPDLAAAAATEAFAQSVQTWTTDAGIVWYGSAGAATTAVVRLSDGKTYPAVLAEGTLYGWYPAGVSETPVLVGYGPDGEPVGEVPLTLRWNGEPA